MSNIDFDRVELVIFDLGGVILNLDYGRTQTAFSELGISDVEQLYSQASQNDLFDQMERGEIADHTFRQGLRSVIGKDIEDAQLDKAWNALILDMPPHRLDFISQLKANYKTALLSNTNEIHIRHFEGAVDQVRFYSCFDLLCYSSRIGCRKPEPEAWHHVLEKMGVEPENALFIDDSIQHIEASGSMGLQTIWLQKGEEISEVLSPLL